MEAGDDGQTRARGAKTGKYGRAAHAPPLGLALSQFGGVRLAGELDLDWVCASIGFSMIALPARQFREHCEHS
jgi:hypothetical protein